MEHDKDKKEINPTGNTGQQPAADYRKGSFEDFQEKGTPAIKVDDMSLNPDPNKAVVTVRGFGFECPGCGVYSLIVGNSVNYRWCPDCGTHVDIQSNFVEQAKRLENAKQN